MDNELIEASKAGDFHKVSELFEKGVNIHAQNDGALRYASQRGYLEVVKFLVDKGADIHAKNDYALSSASQNGHLGVVKFLIDKGADIHAENDYPLRWASFNGHLEIVKFLIDKGTNMYVLPFQDRLKLGIPVIWSTKPDTLPPFRKTFECPISKVEFNSDVSQLGCSNCLNVYEKEALENWFKIGQNMCPMCRTKCNFYLV